MLLQVKAEIRQFTNCLISIFAFNMDTITNTIFGYAKNEGGLAWLKQKLIGKTNGWS